MGQVRPGPEGAPDTTVGELPDAPPADDAGEAPPVDGSAAAADSATRPAVGDGARRALGDRDGIDHERSDAPSTTEAGDESGSFADDDRSPDAAHPDPLSPIPAPAEPPLPAPAEATTSAPAPSDSAGSRSAGDAAPADSEPRPLLPVEPILSGLPVPPPAAAVAAARSLQADAGDSPVVPETLEIVSGMCPHLLSRDGTWRAAEPRREHRCTAVDPPAPLSVETQRQLCLVETHRACPAYREAQDRRARQLRRDRISRGAIEALAERPFARTTPVALEGPKRAPGETTQGSLRARTRANDASVAGRVRRSVAAAAASDALAPATEALRPVVASARQRLETTSARARGAIVGTVAMLVVVILAVALVPRPAAAPAAAIRTAPAATEAPAAVASQPPRSPRPKRTQPARTPRPVARTYRVKRGDTLSEIAERFGTTVERLVRLNGIQDPRRIRTGQVLKLP